jgi:cytochrome c oxidase subunit 2
VQQTRWIPVCLVWGIHGAEAMQKEKNCKGSAAIAFILGLFLIAFALVTLYFFLDAKRFGWWPPSPITSFGREVDQQFFRTYIIVGAVFVVCQIALGWVVWRYRDRGGRATYSHGNQTMEVLWTLATLILFVGLGVYAERAWAEVHFMSAAPVAVQIEVQGQQFKWYFRYPGPDGKFGRIAPEYAKDSEQNFFGLDPNDPAGKDDIVTPVIAIPVNREVELTIRSKDVTHSFFVRELRLKQDAVPGMVIHLHFTATQIGEYEIACAELCGLGHHQMRSFLQVKSEPDYENWLREQAAFSSQ